MRMIIPERTPSRVTEAIPAPVKQSQTIVI